MKPRTSKFQPRLCIDICSSKLKQLKAQIILGKKLLARRMSIHYTYSIDVLNMCNGAYLGCWWYLYIIEEYPHHGFLERLEDVPTHGRVSTPVGYHRIASRSCTQNTRAPIGHSNIEES